MDIGQTEVATGVAKREPFVIQAHQMQQRRVQIMHVHLVLRGVVTVVVSRSIGEAAFHTAASHPHREPVRIVIAAIVATVTSGAVDRRLTDYFEVASWPDAYGRNIVNVILVDFRALDTFGEVAVVAVAAIAAWGILRAAKSSKEETE